MSLFSSEPSKHLIKDVKIIAKEAKDSEEEISHIIRDVDAQLYAITEACKKYQALTPIKIDIKTRLLKLEKIFENLHDGFPHVDVYKEVSQRLRERQNELNTNMFQTSSQFLIQLNHLLPYIEQSKRDLMIEAGKFKSISSQYRQ